MNSLIPAVAAIFLLISGVQASLYAQGPKALVLGGAASPSSADGALVARLAALGFQVTYMDDNVAQVGDVEGMDLLVTLASGASGQYLRYQSVPVPVFNSEQAAQDDEYLMTSGARGTTSGQTQIDVVNSDHPVAAGLSGSVTVCSPAESLTYGTPLESAIVVATIAGNPAQASIYAYDTGDAMVGGFPAPARRMHFMLSDNTFNNLTPEGLRLFDAAIRWLADLSTEDAPARIINISPAQGAVFQSASITIGFTATTHPANTIPAGPEGIQMFLNGVDVSASLTVGDNPSNRVITYTGTLLANALYTVEVVVRDDSGRESFRIWNFDTLSEDDAVVIEAENFNFDGGQFIQNPQLTIQVGPDSYYGQGWELGVSGVDYLELGPAARPANPGFYGEWRYYLIADLPQTSANEDFVRQLYANSPEGVPDYDLLGIVAGEWWNYTRDFAGGNYRIYLRARATSGQSIEIHRVTSDPTQPDQTTVLLGDFKAGGDYRFIPLTESGGTEPMVIHLSGIQTLRVVAPAANNDLNLNYLLAVPTSDPATPIGPYAHNLSPERDSASARRNSIAASITNRETLVDMDTIELLVDGLPSAGLTVTPTPAGADVSSVVSPPFGPASTHTALLRFKDTLGNAFSNSWSFTTSRDALPIFTAPRVENGELKLLLAFAEPVDAATAGALPNYSSDQGVAFSAVTLLTDNVVELTGTGVADGQPYLLTVGNVQDALGNVVPETSISYNISSFVEDSNGVVSFEAESYHTNTAGMDPFPAQTWDFSTAIPRYSGAGSMLNTDGSGFVDVSSVASAARLDYRVRFTQAGPHKVWIRGLETPGTSDSVHFGLDGAHFAAVTGLAVGGFNWNDDPEDPATTGINRFDIPVAGDYILNMWVREDGVYIDKIMIVLESADFDPSTVNGGLGPDQSPRLGDSLVPDQPVLQFSRTGISQLTFDWTGAGFHLEQTSDLANPEWTAVPNSDAPPVPVPLSAERMFFQLAR